MAEKITKHLFTPGGWKKKADRLVMMADGREVCGWAYGPATDAVQRILEATTKLSHAIPDMKTPETQGKPESDAGLPPAPCSVDLRPLQLAIESHLKKIESILGPNYKLTLIAKYNGPLKDADILLTLDTPENMLAVINRFYPPNDQAEPRRSR